MTDISDSEFGEQSIPDANGKTANDPRVTSGNLVKGYLTLIDGTLTGNATGYRNLIQNGAFEFWRRGTQFMPIIAPDLPFGPPENPPLEEYTADRWAFVGHKSFTGGWRIERKKRIEDPRIFDVDVDQTYPEIVPPKDGMDAVKQGPGRIAPWSLYVNAHESAPTNSAAYACIRTHIEGYDFAQLWKKDGTLNFWVRSNAPGTYTVNINGANLPYKIDPLTPEELLAGKPPKWQHKFVTVTGPGGDNPAENADSTTNNSTTNSVGAKVSFVLASGGDRRGQFGVSEQVNLPEARGWWQIALVQLESGPLNTTFERRPGAVELERLKRYFQIWTPTTHGVIGNGYILDDQTAVITTQFATPMRKPPIIRFRGDPRNFYVFNGLDPATRGPTQCSAYPESMTFPAGPQRRVRSIGCTGGPNGQEFVTYELQPIHLGAVARPVQPLNPWPPARIGFDTHPQNIPTVSMESAMLIFTCADPSFSTAPVAGLPGGGVPGQPCIALMAPGPIPMGTNDDRPDGPFPPGPDNIEQPNKDEIISQPSEDRSLTIPHGSRQSNDAAIIWDAEFYRPTDLLGNVDDLSDP